MGTSIASQVKHQSLRWFLAILVGLTCWVMATPPAAAYDNPDLLPEEPTFIIDLANSLSSLEEERLNEQLQTLEDESGWKLRVLTQYDRTPGRAVKDYWGLDDHSVLLIADPRGGNLLNFSVGDALFELLPRTFWIELQTRYGNQFFVRDNGENRSILEALGSIETCLRKKWLRGSARAAPRAMDFDPRDVCGGWCHWRVCGASSEAGTGDCLAMGAHFFRRCGAFCSLPLALGRSLPAPAIGFP